MAEKPNATLDSPRHVFLYGTLRRDQERDINLLTPAPTFIGSSQTPGTLYHLGACNYPGLRRGGSAWVQGDVYQITPELECKLDAIERVLPLQTAEYSKQEVRVTVHTALGSGLGSGVGIGVGIGLGGTVELTCLTYEISAQRALGMAVIASGDWLKR